MLTIEEKKSRDRAVLQCKGRLFRGEAVAHVMQAVLAAGDCQNIALDCSELEAIDAGGLSALVELHHWSRARGIRFQLARPSRFVFEILRLTRLDCILEISWQRPEVGIADGVAVNASASQPEFAWFCDQLCS
jgi:anti-anti-sigma factor